jgi:hypothetical protein
MLEGHDQVAGHLGHLGRPSQLLADPLGHRLAQLAQRLVPGPVLRKGELEIVDRFVVAQDAEQA